MSKRDKEKKAKKVKVAAKIVAKPLPAPSASARRQNLAIAKSKAAEKPAPKLQQFAIRPPDLMPGVVPAGKTAAIAMDYAPGVYEFASQCFGSNSDFNGFPGYPYLANLATRVEYRAFASTMASELFREGIKLTSKTDADKSQDNPRIAELEDAIKEFNLLHVFQTIAAQDCFFGRGQISINIKGANDALPLVLAPQTVKKGSLTSFTPIEAMWTSPSAYNAIDPTAPDFYKPRQWFLLGKEVHASRLLTVITRPLPDMLKPAYNFSGMSLSQLAEPYVNNWLRTRQAVSDLINNFSLTILKTNMGQVLQGDCSDVGDIFDRADMFTLTKSNRGLMMVDMEGEEIDQINTPLSGLHELQAQAQEHQCSATRIPAMILTGISPSGLNASSEGEIRAFYDWVSSQQETFYKPPMWICIQLLMLHLWGEIDPTITFEFNPLWQVSALDAATIRVNNANADAVYLDRSVVSPEETRERLAKDQDSGYSGIDVSDLPEPQEIDEEFDASGAPTAKGNPDDDDEYKEPESGNTDNRSTTSQVRKAAE
jgi:phage-related protein (TIGR01555 family)